MIRPGFPKQVVCLGVRERGDRATWLAECNRKFLSPAPNVRLCPRCRSVNGIESLDPRARSMRVRYEKELLNANH